MSYSPLIDEAVNKEKNDGKTLSTSEKTYIRFRKIVDPGMVDASFDLTPSKSSDVRQRGSGERYKDQTLRGHILNGASFGTQFNDALKEIDPRSALDRKDLLKTLALFACHDFHKTDGPQKRRLKQERGLRDEDKDLREDEVRELIDSLNLDDLDLDLSFRDYYASALSTEKMSGRHRQVSSREFDRLKEWVRLMDAAAGMQMPTEASSLEDRVQNIANDLEIHYHKIDDIKGILTNILNSAISKFFTKKTNIESIVYFASGVVYLSPKNSEFIDKKDNLPETLLEKFLRQFIDSLENSRDHFEIPINLSPKGYYKVEPMSYFLSGLENSLGIVKEELKHQVKRNNWDPYRVYDKGLLAAFYWELIDKTPKTHKKAQALGIFAGTVFMELFKPLNGDSTRDSIIDLCNALNLDRTKEKLLAEYDFDGTIFSSNNLSEEKLENISEETGKPVNKIKNEIDSIGLDDKGGGGSKAFTQLVGLAFLEKETAEENPRKELPVEELLSEMEDLFLSYYQSWNKRWDQDREGEWHKKWGHERKIDRFERELQGVLPEASRYYIRSNVEVDGRWFVRKEYKSKYDQYTRRFQPNICLLCNEVLVGGTLSSGIFDASENLVGRPLTFTHLKEIKANEGEPNSVICPICNLEMVLRNSVHDTFTNHEESGDPSQYLLVAPDYFYSPVDIMIERTLKEEISGGGGELLQASKYLIGSDPANRKECMDSILNVLELAKEKESFQNTIKNYDSPFDVRGTIGVYRINPPRRASNSNKLVSRNPSWYLASYFSVLFSWLTSSRVLLTDTPIPTTQFEDYEEMILIEGAPSPVQRFVGETITISRLRDKKEWTEYEFSHLMKGTGENEASKRSGESRAEAKSDPTTRYRLKVNTGLAKALYKLSAFTYVGLRVNQFDVQRFASLLSDLQEPFVGANSLLKGNEQVGDYTALRAADILDTLAYASGNGRSSGRVKQGGSEGGSDGSRNNATIRGALTMRDRLNELAQAGFQAVRPNSERDSNHEYERLFRVARDAISGPVTKSASREELIDIIAGDVMKAASRARKKNSRNDQDRKYASEQYTREPAEEFARIFVEDVLEGICDGEFYELRRLENRLASGYNAAIRRHLQEWFEEHSD